MHGGIIDGAVAVGHFLINEHRGSAGCGRVVKRGLATWPPPAAVSWDGRSSG